MSGRVPHIVNATMFDGSVSEIPQSRIDTNVVEKRTSAASSDEPNMKDLMNMLVNIQSEQNSQKKYMNTLQYMVNEMYYEPEDPNYDENNNINVYNDTDNEGYYSGTIPHMIV